MATFEIRCEVAGKVARIDAQACARLAAGVIEALHVTEGEPVREGEHVATLRA